MRRSSWIVALVLLSTLTAVAGAAPDVVLSVRYDAETRTLEGTADITFVPDAKTAYFTLLANLEAEPNPFVTPRFQDTLYPYGFEPARITVLSVGQVEDEHVTDLPFRLLALPAAWQTYSLQDTVLAVDLPQGAQSSSLTLRCAFVTEAPRTSAGDQGVTEGILTWRFGWFPLLIPDAGSIVEQSGAIAYADRSTFPLVFPWTKLSATFDLPADLHLITGADTRDEVQDDDDERRAVSVSNTSPSRSLAIVIGEGYDTYRLDASTPIEVHYLTHHEREARLIATWATEILQEYVRRYGPYPRSILSIVESPAAGGQAFAADGIIWLSSRFFTHRDVLFPGALDRVTEFVLAHEIAHQWVGLGTGIDLDAEAWLSEGLAQYLSIQYFEQRYAPFGPNLFAPMVPGIVGEYVTRQWSFLNLREHFVELPYYLSLQAGFDEPLIVPTKNVQFGNAKTVRLYDKGYLVARALAALTGEEAFEQALLRAIEERRADLLDVRTFQTLLEETSGLSLDAFFDHWILGAGTADYSVRVLSRSFKDGVHTTRVRASREGGVAQPVIVEATMASKGTVRRTWDGEDPSTVIEFSTPSLVVSVTIDPERQIPDRDRLNNHHPVKIVPAVNKNVLPLDAYVLAPDQATGGLILSHLDRLRVFLSQTAASASVRIGRSHRMSFHAAFAGQELGARLAYTFTGFGQPETGSAGGYWMPSHTLTATLQRHITSEGAWMSARLDMVNLPFPPASGVQSVMLRFAAELTQVQLVVQDEVRLIPRLYLSAAGRIALSSGTVPPVLLFPAPEMKSVPVPPSPQMAVLRIAVDAPSGGALPYSLFHLAMIDGVQSAVFLTAASGWTTPDDFGTTSLRIEAGLEQVFELSTLGGLLSFRARVGVATPVLGPGLTAVYADLSF